MAVVCIKENIVNEQEVKERVIPMIKHLLLNGQGEAVQLLSDMLEVITSCQAELEYMRMPGYERTVMWSEDPDKKDKSILLRLLKEEYDYTYTFDTFYDRMKGWSLSCSWGKVEEQKQ